MRQLIAQRILALIEEKNMSARKLSFAIGKSHSYMNKLVNGQENAPIDVLQQICDELHVTPAEFFANPEADSKNKYLLLREIEDLTEEDIQYLCDSAKYLKKKNQLIRKRK